MNPWADSAIYHLNHVHRDKLKGRNACVAYHCRGYKSFFDIRERRAIYDWLLDKQNDILLEVKALDGSVSNKAAANAWRQAAMIWLWMNEFVKVSLNGKVLPYFTWKNAHK
ncbi:MAG: hypothetical protein A2487_15450 [Candidatus Raymondbacteria bacterium RifOxyC12_full_50_8]|uniref:Uncharacterized protein n=1 Tax=Candidatus Raymondbacteria bacterium RIFOXYD12_FULL_49_13 TaxID=1817890 RepID=A0A1F7FAJ9_UNCRA|nr:MAG: hypothetical protein A2487_15450 [Candidatus Raymondbacteria bacterium RifOxyC12_full_50_8]OGK03526.1 MAG: hypothetical protein A2519_09840 [Candidatus Raymondbacteria bacterium RIFOXYD12_FULL_49_13]